MRKKIAAANWKMNLTYQQGEELLNQILKDSVNVPSNSEVIFAVPFPYLEMAAKKIKGTEGFFVAAQNCSNKASGAYTGETSAQMLQSMGLQYCIVGHSERRQYFNETPEMLAEKVSLCLQNNIRPIFCCGEALDIREAETQNDFVQKQLEQSLFNLTAEEIKKLVIAYEPIWAIGTGKTASTEQAQQMHAHIRAVLAAKFGAETANEISILYGGSVKGGNAAELFSQPDVDGGLVGGASLVASEFLQIIGGLT